MSVFSKYRAIKTTVDGIEFASKKEAARYGVLKILLRAGKIRDLLLQPEFEIVINGVKICKYRADFEYYLDNVRVVEDVKGMKTRMYNLKKKLVYAVYGIKITET